MHAITFFLRKLRIFFARDKFTKMGREMALDREQTRQEMQSVPACPRKPRQHASRRQLEWTMAPFGGAKPIRKVAGFRIEHLQDFRFAIRQLHKNPTFASVAILVLTLGIAASVATFRLSDALY